MSAPATVGPARRWAMLGVGTAAQTASSVAVHGPAFLIPALTGSGRSLAEAGVVASAPLAGIMVALVAWGAVVDRRGERFALLAGLAIAAAATVAATQTESLPALCAALFVAGVGGAATNSATGRVVVGWFPPQRRGLAMGIRQTAQPLGVGIGAATMPALALERDLAAALWVPAAGTLLALVAVALVVIDPPRPTRTAATAVNPYRSDRFLLRVHGVSMLLVVPQFVVWTFALTWLIQDVGWSAAAAGGVVAGTQVVGAASRIGVGWLSDRVGSRVRPLRWVAGAIGATMLALGLTAHLSPSSAVVLLVVAAGVTVAPNGLAFTAIAERSGPFWSGRALGFQNTGQNLVAAGVPPAAGLLIEVAGYPATYAAAAVLPLLALLLVPTVRRFPGA